jgi:tRNA threonylcarbamoyl adenosine modification protein YeaZ
VARWVLGLDTATPWRSLALRRLDGADVRRDAALEGRAMATGLLPGLDAFLARHGVQRADIAAIGVGVGPGSYTGIRIGVAAALGLGRALGVRVAGSGTLEALAYAGLAPGETGWALLDARRGRVHALLARRGDDAVTVLEGPVTCPRSDLPTAGARCVEDIAPDAAWHTLDALHGAPPEPRYG